MSNKHLQRSLTTLRHHAKKTHAHSKSVHGAYLVNEPISPIHGVLPPSTTAKTRTIAHSTMPTDYLVKSSQAVSQVSSRTTSSGGQVTLYFLPTTSATTTLYPNVQLTSSSTTSNSDFYPTVSVAGEQDAPRSMPTVAIVFISVGAALTVFTIIAIIRLCLSRKRKVRQIPSLPILQEDSPKRFTDDGSPLFGGPERKTLSGLGGMSTWAQYNGQFSSAPDNHPAPIKVDFPKATMYNTSTDYTKESKYDHSQQPYSIGEPNDRFNKIKHQQRVQSRLSAVSESLYPMSPANPQEIGVAIDAPMPVFENRRLSSTNAFTDYANQLNAYDGVQENTTIVKGRAAVRSSLYGVGPTFASDTFGPGPTKAPSKHRKDVSKESAKLKRTSRRKSMRPTSTVDPQMTPPLETSLTLGSLMLRDFGQELELNRSRFSMTQPMPSLAQMAMDRQTPDYRSPTYSLYGLYKEEH